MSSLAGSCGHVVKAKAIVAAIATYLLSSRLATDCSAVAQCGLVLKILTMMMLTVDG